MILGVDTGNRTFGWARFDHEKRRFDGIGAIELPNDKALQKTDDQADRVITIGGLLVDVVRDCDIVVVERMSFPPGGQVPIALGFAVTVGVARAASHRPAVYTVKPQTWQRAVLPNSGKKVDYEELELLVGEYVRRDQASAIALDSLAPALRNHALDAAAIAMMGAFRLNECRLVKERVLA